MRPRREGEKWLGGVYQGGRGLQNTKGAPSAGGGLPQGRPSEDGGGGEPRPAACPVPASLGSATLQGQQAAPEELGAVPGAGSSARAAT